MHDWKHQPHKRNGLTKHSKKRGRGRPALKKRANAKRLQQSPIAKAKNASAKPLKANSKLELTKTNHLRKSGPASRVPVEKALNGATSGASESAIRSAAPVDVQSRIRDLIKLAKEQGYLTFDDLNEALPVEVTDADELDAILTRL